MFDPYMKKRKGGIPFPKRSGLMKALSGFLLLFSACGEQKESSSGTAVPQRTEKKEREDSRFLLREKEKGKLLQVLHGEQRKDTSSYLLLEEGKELPDEKEAYEGILELPLERIVCFSSTHAGMLQALGAEDRIIAFPSVELLYDSSLRKRMKSGRIERIGQARTVDTERIVSLGPELLLNDGMSSGERRGTLQRAGITTLDILEWKETHPLARAEWIKVFGALTGKEKRADSLYELRAHAYDSIARLVEKRTEEKPPPTVLCNSLHKGTWHIPGGKSFMVRSIEDAGGFHPWSENKNTGADPKSLEEVLARAGDADTWLNPGRAKNLEALEKMDERVKRIRAFRKGSVYNNDRRDGPERGNDYWESGPMNPQLLLADLVRILHPGVLPEHQLHYYRKLPPTPTR